MSDSVRTRPLEPEEILLGQKFQSEDEKAEAVRAETEKRELKKAYRQSLMQNPLFREFLMEQLISLGTFGNSFGNSPAGFPDPHATFFQAGMKAAGWHLWTLFDDEFPELASLMRREYAKPQS